MLQKFASHSTILEVIGLLLPFLCIPHQLIGKPILLLVDNEAVVYAWNRRMARHNAYVSIFIQTLHMLEAALPCRIFVQYIKRCSTPEAVLVDKLSRTSTTTPVELGKIAHLKMSIPHGPILTWLQNPIPDWTLPPKILSHILHKLL
jgi:hypothetical protein